MSSVVLHRFPDEGSLATAAAADWVQFCLESADAVRPTHVALSGGRISRTFLAAAASLAMEQQVTWASMHFYWADERCVPPDHVESNYAMAHECFFSRANVTPVQIHRIQGEYPPEEAAREASEVLLKLAPIHQGQPMLDLVFLGMGEDGHVASLFPRGLVPDRSDPPYRAVQGPKPPAHRITVTYPVLLAAREVRVLISGAGKQEALKASLAKGSQTPLGWVLERRATTWIYTDVKGV